jgi:hypothetical protein
MSEEKIMFNDYIGVRRTKNQYILVCTIHNCISVLRIPRDKLIKNIRKCGGLIAPDNEVIFTSLNNARQMVEFFTPYLTLYTIAGKDVN